MNGRRVKTTGGDRVCFITAANAVHATSLLSLPPPPAMPLVSPAADTFLTTSAAIFLPSLFLLHIRNRPSKKASVPHARPPYERLLTLLVHVHTLYILYVLTAHWPPNVFTRLNLPLSTPAGQIREVLIERAGLKITDALPKPLESLLSKLGSVEVRMAFVRYAATLSVW